MQSTRITIIGPAMAGKTGLILSMVPSIGLDRNGHGYSHTSRFSIEADEPVATDGIEFVTGAALRRETRAFMLQYNGRYQRTGREDSIARLFIFRREDKETGRSTETRVEIVDTGGEFSDPGYWENLEEKQQLVRSSGDEEAKKSIEKALGFQAFVLDADSIVLVLPAIGFSDGGHIDQIDKFLKRALARRPRKLRRFIVAWSRLDLVLAPLRAIAAEIAHEPDLVFELVQTFLAKYERTASMLDRYAANNSEEGLDIHHIAVSSHGFLRGSGSSNLLFHDDPAHYALPADEKYWVVNKYWQPYLAADPFLCAVFGPEGNEFCFSHAQLREQVTQTPKSQQNVKAASKERTPTFFEIMLEYLKGYLKGSKETSSG